MARIVDDEILEVRRVTHGKHARHFVRADQLRPELCSMKVMRLAGASSLHVMGLPLSVVQELRASGELASAGSRIPIGQCGFA